MKISKSKDYKKPLYALGAAAVLVAASLTGCHSGVELEGETQTADSDDRDTSTSIVELEGVAETAASESIVENEETADPTASEDSKVDCSETEDELELEGCVALAD